LTSPELEGRLRLLVRELSAAEIELSNRAEQLEHQARRLRVLEQLAQRLTGATSVDDCVQPFCDLLRPVVGACAAELWRASQFQTRFEKQKSNTVPSSKTRPKEFSKPLSMAAISARIPLWRACSGMRRRLS